MMGVRDVTLFDKTASLGSLGIDSLIAVEIKQTIERLTGVCLSLKEVRDITIAGLQALAAAPAAGEPAKQS